MRLVYASSSICFTPFRLSCNELMYMRKRSPVRALVPVPRIIRASSCAEMKIGTLLGASSLDRAAAKQWHSCLADQVLPVPEREVRGLKV